MGLMRNRHQSHTNPGRIFRGFFVFLPNTFDFSVKIDDNPNTRVTTTSDNTTATKGKTMKSVFFSNRDYVVSHGKNPSGRGSWAFIVTDASCGTEVETVFAPGCLTLTEAKKWMRNYIHQNWAAELATGKLYVKIGS